MSSLKYFLSFALILLATCTDIPIATEAPNYQTEVETNYNFESSKNYEAVYNYETTSTYQSETETETEIETPVKPHVTLYSGADGGNIICYCHTPQCIQSTDSSNIYAFSTIRLQGEFSSGYFQPKGYEGQDISGVQYFQDLCDNAFYGCNKACWAGGESGSSTENEWESGYPQETETETETETGYVETEAETETETGYVETETVTETGYVETETETETGYVETETVTETGYVETETETGYVETETVTETVTETGYVETETETETGYVETETETVPETGYVETETETETETEAGYYDEYVTLENDNACEEEEKEEEETTSHYVDLYNGSDGGDIICYCHTANCIQSSASDDYYQFGRIRLQGEVSGGYFQPSGYAGQDIGSLQYFKNLCNNAFYGCNNSCWAGDSPQDQTSVESESGYETESEWAETQYNVESESESSTSETYSTGEHYPTL